MPEIDDFLAMFGIAPGQLRGALPIRIDHRAYFLNFCQIHGGNPVMHKGRLLFRDGWMHSATDYKGPEIEPPEDRAKTLRLTLVYWQKRRAIVYQRVMMSRAQLRSLEALASMKSAPIMHRAITRDDEGRVVSRSQEVDFNALEMNVSALEEELKEADAALAEVREEIHVKGEYPSGQRTH